MPMGWSKRHTKVYERIGEMKTDNSKRYSTVKICL